MFKFEDAIEKINKKAKTLYTCSQEESLEIEKRIYEEMRKVDMEYKMRNAKSIESAKRAYITFWLFAHLS